MQFYRALAISIFISAIASTCSPKVASNASPYRDMVLIKGGTFYMGSDSADIRALTVKFKLPFDYLATEIPRHKVQVHSFYMDKYEVTNAEFKKFIDANPQWKKENISPSLHNGSYLKTCTNNSYPQGEDNYPVTNITWYAAMAYAKWAGKRLPSEAEWEYAAKSGRDVQLQYPWGNDAPDSSKANYIKSGIKHATTVGGYAPNAAGLYDMAGNVWEYCLDAWDDKFYQHSPVSHPVSGQDSLANYLAIKTRRVIRGGSWGGGAVNMRTTFRDSHPVTGAGDHVGFRCVKDVK
jgi:sulfatase modifying factor 1